MLSKKSAIAGRLILPPNVTNSTGNADQYTLEPLFDAETPTNDQLQPNLTTQELLSMIFQERKTEGLARIPLDTLRPELMDKFAAMTSELEAEDWLKSNDISLCHLDFEPRNILVDPTDNVVSPIASGILDWDSVVLAPSFISCAPPM